MPDDNTTLIGPPAPPPEPILGSLDGLSTSVPDSNPALASLSGPTAPSSLPPSAPVVGANPAATSSLAALGEQQGAGVQPPHRILNSVLKALAIGVAGAAAGGGAKRPGEAAARGVETGIGLTQQAKENTFRQNQQDLQKQQVQSAIKFQNVQAAELTARAAMYDKQLHNMDQEFQDQHNQRTLEQMKEMASLGITPTIVADNHGKGANAALTQLTQSHGAVPPMFILNLGDKIVGYDMSQLGGMNALRDKVNQVAEIEGKGPEAYTASIWGMMSPEAKNTLMQQSLGFFNPMPTKDNIDNVLQQYKNYQQTYALNPKANSDLKSRLDSTVKMLDGARQTFIKQKGEEAAALIAAETPAKVEQATTIARAEAPIRVATAAAEETARLNAQLKVANSQQQAQMLVDGDMDPTQLQKRGNTYGAVISAANEYSRSKYGKPFDMAKAESDWKFANNVGTQNTLKYLNSLTGASGQPGNLDALIDQSKKVGNTKFPALNDVQQWAKLNVGNADVAAYHATITEVADQVAKILQGGGSGAGTSDAKLKQAQDLFNAGFNPAQINAVAGTLRTLLGNRKRELIGDNRYLQKSYGDNTPPLAKGFTRVKASDGSTHDFPTPNLDKAKQIDPNLTVVQQN